MKKFNEMSNKSKAMIGVGTILGVAGIGTGVALATSTDVPADTKTVDDNMDKNENTKVNEAKEVVVAEKEDDKKKETNKDVDGKESEVTKKEKIEIKGDEQEEEAEKEENVKKETEEKEDGTKVTTEKTESKTPTAVVKVEKAPASSEKAKSTPVSKPAQKPAQKVTEPAKKPAQKVAEPAKKPAQPVKKQPVITTKTTTATETIGFKTETKNDSSLEKGKTKVVREGQNGTLTITYKETYKDGKLSSKDKVSSKVTKNAVNKVVHVGTKAPAPAYLSASQAHSILAGSGMKRSGNEYSLKIGSYPTAVWVKVGSNHVSTVSFNSIAYVSYEGSRQEYIENWGPEEGPKEYEYGQQVRAQIEKALRSAVNAVHGSGTSKANALYNQMINSWDPISKSF